MNSISFWTPVKYDNQPTTLLQKATEFVDDYFYLGGKVAYVTPADQGKVILGPGKAPLWKTTLKVISCCAILINLLVTARYPRIKQHRTITHFQMMLNCLPLGMLIMKAALRQISRFYSVFPIQHLPKDLRLVIFKFLEPKDLGRASRVCREWKELASMPSLWKVFDLKKLFPKLSVIHKGVWEKHVDIVSYGLSFEGEDRIDRREVIKNLYEMFANLEIEGDAGITLMTIPEGHTFNKLVEFAASPKEGNKTGFSYIAPDLTKQFRDDPVKKTYLVALTNSVLKNSRNVMVEKQQNRLTELKCDLPDVLEASTLPILTYISSHEASPTRLYSDTPCTFTRCLIIKGWPFFVGDFAPGGLDVCSLSCGLDNYGFGALRKFEVIAHKSLGV